MASELRGPIESNRWPEKLLARVVTPGARPRVHGYDVESDLAAHYGTAEMAFLALCGEIPSKHAAHAFELALAFFAPTPISQAPTHAASLARLCGARTSAIIGAGAIALAEQARAVIDEHAGLLAWLDRPVGPLPEPYHATDDDDRASVVRLKNALVETTLAVPALELDPSRLAALLALLHASGLRRPEQFEAAIVWARLPCLMAEALAVEPGAFREYPIDLPAFRYEEPR